MVFICTCVCTYNHILTPLSFFSPSSPSRRYETALIRGEASAEAERQRLEAAHALAMTKMQAAHRVEMITQEGAYATRTATNEEAGESDYQHKFAEMRSAHKAVVASLTQNHEESMEEAVAEEAAVKTAEAVAVLGAEHESLQSRMVEDHTEAVAVLVAEHDSLKSRMVEDHTEAVGAIREELLGVNRDMEALTIGHEKTMAALQKKWVSKEMAAMAEKDRDHTQKTEAAVEAAEAAAEAVVAEAVAASRAEGIAAMAENDRYHEKKTAAAVEAVVAKAVAVSKAEGTGGTEDLEADLEAIRAAQVKKAVSEAVSVAVSEAVSEVREEMEEEKEEALAALREELLEAHRVEVAEKEEDEGQTWEKEEDEEEQTWEKDSNDDDDGSGSNGSNGGSGSGGGSGGSGRGSGGGIKTGSNNGSNGSGSDGGSGDEDGSVLRDARRAEIEAECEEKLRDAVMGALKAWRTPRQPPQQAEDYEDATDGEEARQRQHWIVDMIDAEKRSLLRSTNDSASAEKEELTAANERVQVEFSRAQSEFEARQEEDNLRWARKWELAQQELAKLTRELNSGGENRGGGAGGDGGDGGGRGGMRSAIINQNQNQGMGGAGIDCPPSPLASPTRGQYANPLVFTLEGLVEVSNRKAVRCAAEAEALAAEKVALVERLDDQRERLDAQDKRMGSMAAELKECV